MNHRKMTLPAAETGRQMQNSYQTAFPPSKNLLAQPTIGKVCVDFNDIYKGFALSCGDCCFFTDD
jgi:hypothetical protein